MGSLFRQKGLWAAQDCHSSTLIISTRLEIHKLSLCLVVRNLS